MPGSLVRSSGGGGGGKMRDPGNKIGTKNELIVSTLGLSSWDS